MSTPSSDQPNQPDSSTADQMKSRNGLGRIWRAARYSAQGLAAAWRHEAAFRQEIVLFAILVPFAVWLATGPGQLLMLLGSLILVLALELLNSAIEALADAVSMQRNPLLGRAKDMGSAAIALGLLIAAGVWAYCIWERLR